ncbi:MAG: type IX secretion system sortase PorU [Saprospiraceae bacterium]|nr:type IX secretion system sortase PorU [Saprospiraceae bacterium]MDW8484697.1 type IX secretion system sortase PorU [Saprospiraceae bacterium]
MKKKFCLLVWMLFCWSILRGQDVIRLERQLTWHPQPEQIERPNGDVWERWSFEGGFFSDAAPTLPFFAERFPLRGRSQLRAVLNTVRYEPISLSKHPDLERLTTDLQLETEVVKDREEYYGWVRFYPFRRSNQGFERVVSFSLTLYISAPEPAPITWRGGPNTFNSVLSKGSVYKFGVSRSGIYRLDFNFLRNTLGISNLESVDPRRIHLYGNGGAMLPERAGAHRPDDLVENAIFVAGEADGRFDNTDYILFYAVGPQPWSYRPSANLTQLTITPHLYDNFAYYFLIIEDTPGLRIFEQSSAAATFVTEEFDDVQRIEDDRVNLLHQAAWAQGSGKRWFGDYFFQIRERTYNFSFPNAIAGSSARLTSVFAGRSAAPSTVQITVGSTTFSGSISGVAVSNTEDDYAREVLIAGSFALPGPTFTAKVHYLPTAAPSEGWLDYLEIQVRRRLVMTGSMMEFRDLRTLAQPTARFRLSNVNANIQIWDITTPQKPRRLQYSFANGVAEFGTETQGVLRNFIAFYDNASLPRPERTIGRIANQNVHGLTDLDMVVIYHPDFEAAVNELVQHRRSYSGLNVAAVRIDHLYNEFSSGAKDPTAIRDFARMLYQRSPSKFRYLLLVGDGSFDPRNITNSNDNLDFIPVYETFQSFDPIRSYPTDDYFGLLDDDEGENIIQGAVDIAVGRLTPRSLAEAQAIVSKILEYDNSAKTLGDWRLRLLFMADDEDSNAHIRQADLLATRAARTETWFNIEKVYFDAYQQIATNAEKRIPGAKAAINANIFRGCLIGQYIGHGGPRGWAQERVIDNNDIASWNNTHRYPLIITATCSFGGFDDYTILTGAEQALLKPNAGAIALFTTVRSVYINANNELTDAIQDFIFKRDASGRYSTIGEMLRRAKNVVPYTSWDNNSRRFTLLGDPSMHLALPDYRVRTTRLNNKPFNPQRPDTLRALMPVTIEGEITDQADNLLSNFDGRIYVTLFDKKRTLRTLGQDPGSPVFPFDIQNSILFRGSATVKNGRFAIQFVIPKDINYAFGFGKISYYAENGTPFDAAGADTAIVIGGTFEGLKDDTPPVIQVFLNNEDFVQGGITHQNPILLVKCTDDHGMNVTGAGLGHDLTAVLNDNALETIVLNDFYESAQDDARQGRALYPLRGLAPGRYTVRAKGWDVANNPGEGYTDFVVAEDGKAALAHVLNYPNPFSTNTYFQFEHNLAGQLLDVQISIFTVSGKLVTTLHHSTIAEGFRVSDIAWNGRDEYGVPLARGVYLYRIKVRGTDSNGKVTTVESNFEKLVIIK